MPEYTLSLGAAVMWPASYHHQTSLMSEILLTIKDKMTNASFESIWTMGLLPFVDECIIFIKLVQLEGNRVLFVSKPNASALLRESLMPNL